MCDQVDMTDPSATKNFTGMGIPGQERHRRQAQGKPPAKTPNMNVYQSRPGRTSSAATTLFASSEVAMSSNHLSLVE